MVDEELKQLFDRLEQQNAAAHAETRRHVDEVAAETRRHFDAVAEQLEGRIQLVAESVVNLEQKLDREIESVRVEMRHGFAETQAMIKFSHAELDRRVRALEQNHLSLEKTVHDLLARVERLESTTH